MMARRRSSIPMTSMKVHSGDSRMEGTTASRPGPPTGNAWRSSPIGRVTAGSGWQAIVGGKAERLTRAEQGTSHAPESWSPKVDSFLYSVTRGSDVSLRRFSLPEKQDLPFGGIRSSTPTDAVFSPNGRWVAYTSTEGGQSPTVYVQPFPETGDKFQLVARGSDNPHEAVWSPDGYRLSMRRPAVSSR